MDQAAEEWSFTFKNKTHSRSFVCETWESGFRSHKRLSIRWLLLVLRDTKITLNAFRNIPRRQVNLFMELCKSQRCYPFVKSPLILICLSGSKRKDLSSRPRWEKSPFRDRDFHGRVTGNRLCQNHLCLWIFYSLYKNKLATNKKASIRSLCTSWLQLVSDYATLDSLILRLKLKRMPELKCSGYIWCLRGDVSAMVRTVGSQQQVPEWRLRRRKVLFFFHVSRQHSSLFPLCTRPMIWPCRGGVRFQISWRGRP